MSEPFTLIAKLLGGLSADKRAVLTEMLNPIPEPIAIIGMGCRFPGNVRDPDSYWRLLCDGVDAIGEIPRWRWDVDACYDPDPEQPGKMYTRWGGFLDDVDQFDPAFFGISPREAEAMDPQQRILLEVAWEAMENAGLAVDRLAGTQTGVYIGMMNVDYLRMMLADPAHVDPYSGSGGAASVASGRLSYLFNFKGPCMVLDTACSSSLVAVHLACQSLRNKECDLALAAGVNAILSPDVFVSSSKMHMLAPDGRCKTFDAKADGFARGEGCGVVVLKRLADALDDGDEIVALIRGTAVNQDGRSNGITAPNMRSQQALILQALEFSKVQADQIGYIEAHGTGTALGDPIEIEALRGVLGSRSGDRPCWIGSTKTNFGHLESAAGIAGLIKAALCLKHHAIPPHLHLQTLNPHIDLEGSPLVIPTRLTPWPAFEHETRIAGVSAFGFSGTNAHAILEEPPRRTWPDSPAAGPYLLTLSARNPEALRTLAHAHASALRDGSLKDAALADVCYTAAVRRTHHDLRLAIVGNTREELCERLARFEGKPAAGLLPGTRPPGKRPKLAFVFTGQGGQWAGMGRELLEHEPAFREVVDRCEAALTPHVTWSLAEVLRAGLPDWERDPEVLQPALFALAAGLAAVWKAWGIEPDAVVGHSMGELVAAHVAGALELEVAIRMVHQLGKQLKTISGRTEMAMVELPLGEAEALVAAHGNRLSIAITNSPRSTILVGVPALLNELLGVLRARDIHGQLLHVDIPTHSPLVETIGPALAPMLTGIQPHPTEVPFYSTVTGQPIDGRELGGAYWMRNLREPVRFSATLPRMIADGYRLFVEVSAHPILAASALECAPVDQPIAYLSSLRQGRSVAEVLLETTGSLFAAGHPIDWWRQYRAALRPVSLPAYPWQQRRYWLSRLESRPASGTSPAPITAREPLLGTYLLAQGKHVWKQELSLAILPYLRDHRLRGEAVLPAACYLEMAMAGAGEAYGGRFGIEDVKFERGLVLPADGGPTTMLVIAQAPSGRLAFQIASPPGKPEAAWGMHATGTIAQAPAAATAPIMPLEAVLAQMEESIEGAAFQAAYAAREMELGPAFHIIRRYWSSGDRLVAQLAGTDALVVPGEGIHPVLLEVCILAAGALFARRTGIPGPCLARQVARIQPFGRPEGELWLHVASSASDLPSYDVALLDPDGKAYLIVQGLAFEPIDRPQAAPSAFTAPLAVPKPPGPGAQTAAPPSGHLAPIPPDSRAPQAPQAPWKVAIAGAPDRPAWFREQLRQLLGEVMKLEPEAIDPEIPLLDLGFDSMAAIELRKRLESALGLEISATMVWNHPTLDALVAHLLSKLGAGPVPALSSS